MSREFSDLQKYKIKEMVDEIIVNRGILKSGRKYGSVDDQEFEELSRLAFRYYKMIMKGESPLDIDGRFTPQQKPSESRESSAVKCCIGCNSPLSSDSIRRKMPVCDDCLKKVKTDYEILKDIFA
jgi:hypothetical protein